jgi:hypothetical protein
VIKNTLGGWLDCSCANAVFLGETKKKKKNRPLTEGEILDEPVLLPQLLFAGFEVVAQSSAVSPGSLKIVTALRDDRLLLLLLRLQDRVLKKTSVIV